MGEVGLPVGAFVGTVAYSEGLFVGFRVGVIVGLSDAPVMVKAALDATTG